MNSKDDLGKRKKLFIDQVLLLDTFLKNSAITKEQYDKSLKGLEEKMGLKKDNISGDYNG